jgi:hypothetical protein
MAFLIQGQVHKVFTAPGGTGKDGKPYSESHRLQLLCPVILKNGEIRDELYTMTMPGGLKQAEAMRLALGSDVTLPVGLIASGGKITPFLAHEEN